MLIADLELLPGDEQNQVRPQLLHGERAAEFHRLLQHQVSVKVR